MHRRVANILCGLLLLGACSEGTDRPGAPGDPAADAAATDHSTPRIVPTVTPAAVAAEKYPPLALAEIIQLPLERIEQLAAECRELVRSGCADVYAQGVELTRGVPSRRAEHVQFQFDQANELARLALWEDGQLAEDRFAAEDSKDAAGPVVFAGVQRAEQIYKWVIAEQRGTPWEAQAALELARLYHNGLSARWDRAHRDRARRLFAQVVRDYPKTPQAAQATAALGTLGAQEVLEGR